LKQGMRSSEVTCLQTKLGMTTVTGYFGSLTKASVIAFQTNHSLVADGIVGAKTRAALVGTSTEALCPNGMTLASNCSKAPTTTPTATEALCPNGMTLASNCATAPTGNTTSFNGLTGGAGDITITETSTDVEDEVAEGKSEKVLGFKVDASGSDISLTNVKIEMQEAANDAKSYRLADYVESVDIYKGSTKVGSADASDFSKDVTTYTKSISLSNAIIKEGDKDTFYVVVNAISNLDSADVDKAWDVTLDSSRFQDATGVIMSDSTSGITAQPEFTSLASSSDVKLTISKASSSPITADVEVSDTSSTADVLMLAFKLKATGSDMSFDQLTVNLATTGVPATKAGTEMIFDELVLKNGSDEIASVDSAATATTAIFDLDDTFTIDADSTESFDVYAKIKEISTAADAGSAAFSQGDSLKVSLVQSGIEVEDENADVVTDESGSANGEPQSFVVEGLTVDVKSATVTVDTTDAALGDVATFKWVLDVTAFGDNDVYINRDAAQVVATNSATEVNDIYAFDLTGTTLATPTATIVKSGTDITSVTGDASVYGAEYNGDLLYKIAAGSTGTITITVTGVNAGEAKQVAAHLTGIEWTTDFVEDTGTSYDASTANMQNYTTNIVEDTQTPYAYVN